MFELLDRLFTKFGSFLVGSNLLVQFALYLWRLIQRRYMLPKPPKIRRTKEEPKMASYTFKPFQLLEICFDNDEGYEDVEDIEDDIPLPRSGHRISFNRNGIYVFGGYNHELGDKMFAELWRFNINSYRWELLLDSSYEQMPQELASMTIWRSGNAFLIYGGSGYPFGQQNSNKLHICETGKDPPTIQEIQTTGEQPPALYGQAIVVNEGFLYVIGGTSGFDYSSDIYELNLRTREWHHLYQSRPEIRETDPHPRYRHELAIFDDKIYLFGGGTTEVTFDLVTIPVFDINSRSWSHITTKSDPKITRLEKAYPKARKFHSLVQEGEDVIVTGGSNELEYLRDIWKLNLRTKQWTLLKQSSLPNKLFFHDATIQDGCMYIFGGVCQRGGALVRTRSLYKMWVTVPKLKTICVDAIRSYVRANNTRLNMSNISDLPTTYINQVL